MKYDSIIWDFNGTIYDDLETCFILLNDMLKIRGLSPIESIDRYKDVFGFPVRDYYVKAGFDLEKEDFGAMSEEYIRNYRKATKNCTLANGIRELLKEFHALGIPMYILSACEQKMLESYVSDLEISEYINAIYGLNDHLAKGKEDAGKKLMEEQKPKAPVLIGDTDHDLEVAESIGADCIFVSWGHHPTHKLAALGKPVCDNAAELKKTLLES